MFHVVVEDERLCVGPAGPRSQTTDERHARVLVVDQPEQVVSRESEGVGEENGELGAGEIRHIVCVDAFLRIRGDVERFELGSGQARSPRRDSGPVFELSIAAYDALRDAADRVPGVELLPHDRRDRCCTLEVLGRHEHEDEVDIAGGGSAVQCRAQLGGERARGLFGVVVGRKRRGDPRRVRAGWPRRVVHACSSLNASSRRRETQPRTRERELGITP